MLEGLDEEGGLAVVDLPTSTLGGEKINYFEICLFFSSINLAHPRLVNARSADSAPVFELEEQNFKKKPTQNT